MKGITLAFALFAGSAYGQAIKVKLEDQVVKFDVPPVMRNKVTMIPVRNLLDAMKGTLRWDIAKETVTIWKGHHRIDFIIGNRQANVDGKVIAMDEAAFVDRGRLFVPLKFVATSTGYTMSSEGGFLVLRPVR